MGYKRRTPSEKSVHASSAQKKHNATATAASMRLDHWHGVCKLVIHSTKCATIGYQDFRIMVLEAPRAKHHLILWLAEPSSTFDCKRFLESDTMHSED